MFKILLINTTYEKQQQIESILTTVEFEFQLIVATSIGDGILLFFEEHPAIVIAQASDQSDFSFRLSKLRKNLSWNSFFMLISNSYEDAIQAIKSNFDELLIEPYPEVDLKMKLQDIVNLAKPNVPKANPQTVQPTTILIKTLSEDFWIDTNSIVFCRGEGSYCALCLVDGREVMASCNVGKIERQLNNPTFFRVNRSEIINLSLLNFVDKPLKTCGINWQNKVVEFKISVKQFKQFTKLNII